MFMEVCEVSFGFFSMLLHRFQKFFPNFNLLQGLIVVIIVWIRALVFSLVVLLLFETGSHRALEVSLKLPA